MAKRQKWSVATLVKGRGVTLAAVVMLSVSIGGFMLPRIFAATADDLVVSTISATPSNTAAYTITFRWTGRTNTGNWHVILYKGSTVISDSRQEAYYRTLNGVACGVNYTAKVQAVGPNGGLSPYKQATTATRCPSAAWASFAASGNNVNSSWSSTSGFAQSYNYYLKTGGGSPVASSTTATSRTISGTCGTTYSAYLIPYAGGQYGPATNTVTASTAACPPPPAPKPAPAPAPTTSTTTKPKTTTTAPKTSSAAPATAAPAAPEAPANFSAEINSQKIVTLIWDAAPNADHYVLRRSTDNANWQDLSTTKGTTYTDESTEFATTYYYQLQAVNAANQASATIIAQATTEAFESTSDTVTSSDKLVTVKLPSDAIDGDHNCSLAVATQSLTGATTSQSIVIGPYEFKCITANGDVVDTFNKPVTVTAKLAKFTKDYENFSVRTKAGNDAWQTQKSTYDDKSQQISFNLTSAKSFAIYGDKQHSIWGTILLFMLILLLFAAAVFGFIFWRRRRTPEHVAAVQSQRTAEQEFRQALAQPDCTHLGMAQQVIPSSQGCLDCEQQHTHWNALRICLICGHVGCSDDSPEQHAYKHYQQTGHPIIYDYGDANGNSIGWCYIDQTYI